MYISVLVQRVSREDQPVYDAVADVTAIVVPTVVVCIVEYRVGLDGILIQARSVEPFVAVRPQELNGVTLTEIEGVQGRLVLTRTNDDVVEIGAVAVPNDGVVVVVHTRPFTFPGTMVLTTLTCVEPRVGEVTQSNRVVHDVVFAAEGRVVVGQGRCDTQGEEHDRVTSASRRVFVDDRVHMLFPNRIRILTTEDERQLRFTDDRVNTNGVGAEDADMGRVHRVALQRITDGGIVQINLIEEGHTTLVEATVEIDSGIHRNLHGQVERVELRYISVSVKYGVGINTGRRIFLSVEAPNEGSCIERADGDHIAVLGYYMQVMGDLTTGNRIECDGVVRSGRQLGDLFAEPGVGLAFMQDYCLLLYGLGRYEDLQIDDAVTSAGARTIRYRVVIERI